MNSIILNFKENMSFLCIISTHDHCYS